MRRRMMMGSMLVTMLLFCAVLEAQGGHRWGLAPANGTKLYYEVAGTGPAVVLIHGGWLNSSQWDDLFAALRSSYRVIRYDMRGAGRSPLGDSAYSHAEDLTALLAHLAIDAVHIVSLSAGSQCAIDFALTQPHSVHSMILGASPLAGFDMGAEFMDGMRGVVSAGAADDLQALHERMWAFAPFRVAARMPEVRKRLESLIIHQNTWATSRPNAPRPKPRPAPPATRLGEIQKPVLVVVGTEEMPALVREAEFVADRIPGAELVRLKGAGHFPNLERPVQYHQIVRRWLARQQELVPRRAESR